MNRGGGESVMQGSTEKQDLAASWTWSKLARLVSEEVDYMCLSIAPK